MKHCLLIILCLIGSSCLVNAQMDDKFYYPSKKMQPIDSSLKVEEVVFQTDTIQLSGILLKPTQKPKATILFYHGAGGNVSTYIFMTKPLVNAGYQVFMVDFRGYGKSTGVPTHLNIAQDGQLILEQLLKRNDVRNTKVILYGASMGSQVATHLAKNNEAKVAALILDGAISSFTDIAADHSPAAQRDMIRQFLPSPYSAKEDIKLVQKIPVLFIHSKEDKDVPYHQGEAVFNNAPGKKSFLVYEGKHLEAMKTDPGKVIESINQLISK
ncbi:MAG TPA: alpha/beta fold hydrolase [Flavisolibacter sp.]|nr:alpha/beta fold hydrolase [Flavisolibacter sp.]